MPERTSYGPDDARLVVKTYREGVAAKVGHDLTIEVTRWSATVEDGTVTVEADPRSLEVREGVRGVKPLTDRDRAEIRKNIDEKVLRGQPIAFRGTVSGEAGAVELDGELTMGGATRPLRARLQAEGGRVGGTIALTQSEWGIKPYRGLMGALKVRDDLEVVVDAPAP
jgi:polyisoprenoid-binding protein YceI